MKKQPSAVLTMFSLMLASAGVMAGGGYTGGVIGQAKSDWQTEAFYDACMNGDVSSTGLFRSQLEEDKAKARMATTAQPSA